MIDFQYLRPMKLHHEISWRHWYHRLSVCDTVTFLPPSELVKIVSVVTKRSGCSVICLKEIQRCTSSKGPFGFLFKLFILSALTSAVKLPALSKDKSSEILHRSDRDNSFHRLEEALQGDLERECIEEICYYEGRDR